MHKHETTHTVEVCSCGATRSERGEWTPGPGQSLVRLYLDKSTPEERSENSRRGARKRWAGKPEEARKEFMKYVASAPRPRARIQDRCPCGKFSRRLAQKRGHKCEAAA